MTDHASLVRRLARHGVVPVLTIDVAERAEPLGAALVAGGLPCAEVTFRTGAAVEAITVLRRAFPQMLIGAGTVLDVEQAERATDAGADFVVSPVFDADVVGWCQNNDRLAVPGVMTPTEAATAAAHGVDLVKFFPARSAGGPDALRSMASVLPGLRYMPTGGIDLGNLASYLELPSVVACGGSWLAPPRLIEDGDVTEITRRVEATVALVDELAGRV